MPYFTWHNISFCKRESKTQIKCTICRVCVCVYVWHCWVTLAIFSKAMNLFAFNLTSIYVPWVRLQRLSCSLCGEFFARLFFLLFFCDLIFEFSFEYKQAFKGICLVSYFIFFHSVSEFGAPGKYSQMQAMIIFGIFFLIYENFWKICWRKFLKNLFKKISKKFFLENF